MHRIGNVADLNHFRHANSMFACEPHVNISTACSAPRPTGIVSRGLEAAEVELPRPSCCQHLDPVRLAQARQSRSNRRIEVQNRYTKTRSLSVARTLLAVTAAFLNKHR